MQETALDDRIPVIAPDGTRGTAHRFDESDVVRDGYRIQPRYANLRTKARAAENMGFGLAIAAAVAASVVAGLLVYRLLRMVLDRFVQPKWSCRRLTTVGAAVGWPIVAPIQIGKMPETRAPE